MLPASSGSPKAEKGGLGKRSDRTRPRRAVAPPRDPGNRAGQATFNLHPSGNCVGDDEVAGRQGYELRYFARKHGLTTAQAMTLIRTIGNDRIRLNEAAVRLRRTSRQHHG